MKTLFIAFAVLAYAQSPAHAQLLEDGTDLSAREGHYIAFRLLDKGGNGKMQALVDVGQPKAGMAGNKPSPVIGSDESPMIFFGPVDALNFFHGHGWRYVNDFNIGFQFMLLERIPQ